MTPRFPAAWMAPTALLWLAPACADPRVTAQAPPSRSPVVTVDAGSSRSGVERLIADGRALEPTLTSPFAKRFVTSATDLPRVPPRALYHDAKKTRYYSQREYDSLTGEARAALTKISVDEDAYYSTRYGSPLSYARPLDVLAARGVMLGHGSRVFDFGYGYVGHLRMLASLGLDVTGVDVDPMLHALYNDPSDQSAGAGAMGRLRLLDGAYPREPKIVAAVGNGYDVIVSKNVLKKGYIHPDRPAEKRHLIDLGVSDDVVLRSFFEALRPSGYMLVYNISPALTPPDKPFVPWSDGRSPFTREQWEKAGFRVLAFDEDDFAAANRMAHLLGWGHDGDSPWDVDHDMSALYTLLQRP